MSKPGLESREPPPRRADPWLLPSANQSSFWGKTTRDACFVLGLFSRLEPPATHQCFRGASFERERDVVGLVISQPPLSFTQQPPSLIQDPQADATVQLNL